MAIKYKMLQKAAISERFPFSWLVFNSWDFAIAEPVTARSKMKDITISLKVSCVCVCVWGGGGGGGGAHVGGRIRCSEGGKRKVHNN